MTLTYLLLGVGFFLTTGNIGWTLRRDVLNERTEADLRRLTVPLPERRESIASPEPHEWPQRLTPSDLPGIGYTDELAAVELQSRVFLAAPAPVAVQVGDTGRHHIGVAPGTSSQQARWNSNTGQFWLIVEGLGDLDEPCTHCATPEDGEPAHVGCPGCCCPCRLEEVAA